LTDVLRLLARPDKWYLGSGDGVLWAPPFPRWLDAPGFWDEAHLYQYAVQPAFTLSFLVEGRSLTSRCRRRRWNPAELSIEYDLGPLRGSEVRSAPRGGLRSAWKIRNTTRRTVSLDVVAWTAVDGESLAPSDVAVRRDGLQFTRDIADRLGHRARLTARLAMTPAAASSAAIRSESSTTSLPPQFDLTPFWDRWSPGGSLGNVRHLDGINPRGLVFLGLQRRFRISPGRRVELAVDMTLAFGPRPTAKALRTSRFALRTPAQDWHDFFAAVPSFHCSDPYLERHWWYRWYGLRLNGITPGAPNYRHPTVCEGIGYFHVPISYSAPGQMRELRWLAEPEWARGVLRTFLDHQKPDGSFHGRIYADHLEGTDFYHADWGGALLALDAVHPDPAFQAEVYPGLARYAGWLLETRDPEGSGMFDVLDQYETGQEYMSRYQAVDSEADRHGWENRIRLKGIDITVYAYRLFRALEAVAATTAPSDVARWTAAADRTGHACREQMWDAETGMFFDVDPVTGTRTGVKAAACFYPYATDLTTPEHLAGFGRHLFNPREFWTPYPVPSSSADDPRFQADAEWKGKRHNCPWNGRVWPMTNSHVGDALARVVRTYRPDWAPRLGHFLRRYFRMMTDAGRPDRPNCFEHYHPITGKASRYRGIDDYQHSWINDLIVSQVLGVLPHGPTGVTVHPLRLGVTRATLDGLPVAGHRLRVAVEGNRFRVAVDGRAAGKGRVGEAVTIDF